RWNISYDDGLDNTTHVFNICTTWPWGLNFPDIINNTIYVSSFKVTGMFGKCGTANALGTPLIDGAVQPLVPEGFTGAYIQNNIFYALGTTSYPAFNHTYFSNNHYYAPTYTGGSRPLNEPLTDGAMLVSDPMLVDPSSPGIGHLNTN